MAASAARRAAVRAPPSNRVSLPAAVTDQTWLAGENRPPRVSPEMPPEAEIVTVGKKAATATPIRSLCDCTRRSAWATSGRRSSRSEGMPAGTAGTRRPMGETAIDSSEGGRPIRVAMAFSNCTRVSRTEIAWAWIVWICVCAVITSERAATPAAYWFSVMASVRLKFSTLESRTCRRASA